MKAEALKLAHNETDYVVPTDLVEWDGITVWCETNLVSAISWWRLGVDSAPLKLMPLWYSGFVLGQAHTTAPPNRSTKPLH